VIHPGRVTAAPSYFISNTTDMNRYRVHLIEKLHYCVDVLAESEGHARDIALETEWKGEGGCSSFDADEIARVPPIDGTFSPINGCPECGAAHADFESELSCPACRGKAVAA
jgi:hypothetical protein